MANNENKYIPDCVRYTGNNRSCTLYGKTDKTCKGCGDSREGLTVCQFHGLQKAEGNWNECIVCLAEDKVFQEAQRGI